MTRRALVSCGGKKDEHGWRGILDLQRFLRFGGTHAAYQNQCPEGGVVEIVDVAFPFHDSMSSYSIPHILRRLYVGDEGEEGKNVQSTCLQDR